MSEHVDLRNKLTGNPIGTDTVEASVCGWCSDLGTVNETRRDGDTETITSVPCPYCQQHVATDAEVAEWPTMEAWDLKVYDHRIKALAARVRQEQERADREQEYANELLGTREDLQIEVAKEQANREDASRRLSRAIEWQRRAVVVLQGFREISQMLGKPHVRLDTLIAEAEGLSDDA